MTLPKIHLHHQPPSKPHHQPHYSSLPNSPSTATNAPPSTKTITSTTFSKNTSPPKSSSSPTPSHTLRNSSPSSLTSPNSNQHASIPKCYKVHVLRTSNASPTMKHPFFSARTSVHVVLTSLKLILLYIIIYHVVLKRSFIVVDAQRVRR